VKFTENYISPWISEFTAYRLPWQNGVSGIFVPFLWRFAKEENDMDKRIGHTGEKLLKKCSFALLGVVVLAGGGYAAAAGNKLQTDQTGCCILHLSDGNS